MRIIFVRHGEPDYEKDCLTATGRMQAQAAAERLAREGIEEIYASPNGRAAETAAYTAERLGLPVRTLDYMHEISWGGPGVPQEGHPWTLSDWLVAREDFDFYHADWRQHPYFKNNVAVNYLEDISRRFDALLLRQGYRHEGTRYFCETDRQKTFAVFSHGGFLCVRGNMCTPGSNSLMMPRTSAAYPAGSGFRKRMAEQPGPI